LKKRDRSPNLGMGEAGVTGLAYYEMHQVYWDRTALCAITNEGDRLSGP